MPRTNSYFKPAILSLFSEKYSVKNFVRDLSAGIIVGVVALPLSIAFAIASGVKPEQGLVTAVVAGFLISFFSGSKFQIGGPTGAFIVIIYSIVQKHGYDGLATATLMAGVLLIIMGMARLGDVIKFMPYPVTVGFTGGIAVIIFTSQIKDFLGLQLLHTPERFHEKWLAYFQNISHIDTNTFLLAALSIFILFIWPKISRRIPGPLIVIIVCTMLNHYFGLQVDTIGSRFGAIAHELPKFHLPAISWEKLAELSPAALTIALLAGIESLLSAVVADGMTGKKHHSNTELIAQGVANIISPMFNGIPATGAIARTATNIRNGGQSPVAGIIHAVVVLIFFLYLGPLVGLIPMAALAGILIMVAYSMGEWHLFFKIFKGPKSDALVLLVTFLLTVLVDLTAAIEVGVVLASFLFMRRMIAVTEVGFVTKNLEEANDEDDPEAISKKIVPDGVEVFEIQGPFFFGAANKFRDTIDELEKTPKILILRMRYVPIIDATGTHALEEAILKASKEGIITILSGVRPSLKEALAQGGITLLVGEKNVKENIDAALLRAREVLKELESK